MELTLSEFVVALLAGSGLLVLCLTLLSRALQARAERRALARRVICRLCLHAFEVPGHDKLVTCPACGALNERGRGRRLG